MSPRTDHMKSDLIDRVAAIVRARLKGEKAALAEAFVRAYYANVPPADLVGASPESLYGAALSFWQFGRKRTPGEPKIRIFNPRLEEHGWKSAHTVIEIVNDDMPFLVDSVTGELNRRGLTVHLVIHPILTLRRSEAGTVRRLVEEGAADAIVESHMHFEVDEQTSGEVLAALEDGLARVLADVRAVVADWQPMREKALALADELKRQPPDLPRDQVDEAVAFLEWIADDHFTFLGSRDYRVAGSAARRRLDVAPGGLGILRDPGRVVIENWNDLASLSPQVRAHFEAPRLLTVTKASGRATVHRTVYLDVIVLKQFDAERRVVGQHLFTGLFTSAAYSRSPSEIPLLRQKVANTVARSGLPRASHDRKALVHILETYPRDELLQSSEDELFANAMGIVDLQERQRVRLFVRRDPFERFMTGLVYVPRERYNADLRRRFGAILERAFDGKLVAYYPQLATDSVLAQVLYIIATVPGKIPAFDHGEVEARLAEAARTWADHLQTALVESKGEEAGLTLFRRYGTGFLPGYRDATTPAAAVNDVDMIEAALAAGELGINLYRKIEDGEHQVWLKLCHIGGPIALSDVLPMLEHMGLRVIAEYSFEVTPANGAQSIWIHDFEMQSRSGAAIELAQVKDKFEAAFARVWRREVEDDGFNRLIIGAELGWREAMVLRAFCKYLLQARIAFSQAYMEDTLAANPRIARLVVDMFEARFDPEHQRTAKRRAEVLRAAIEGELERVMNLDEDRIIRRFANLVEATLRTNYFQPDADGRPKPYFAFKLDSAAVDELPSPRPWREIFVYGPRMEGIHLRGGAVARGGLRWSDRREDFRTEILGLMKAQIVKNAVIVPVGSKGGFVCKRLPTTGEREAVRTEVVDCYKTLIRGLLDLTDNFDGEEIVHPARVIRFDDDDPYLVVAADKGTAKFSDIANQVSAEYGFWLGDAFASGGSAGYDHKTMGITARGTWESVKRHFRELGHDTQSKDFTVVGVGDMSGDVFGNGMLLSEHIRLIGAFNHLHVFVDPEPDAKKSHAERRRLFEMPRSSWSDYEASLISKGGGVFDRKAKSLKVTPEMKARFGLDKDSVTPNELIRTLLKVKVDLLWFGGIGTYVKARRESDLEVGDRANDAVRVAAHELDCRVIGEGANLGVTQLSRIEFAQSGGRINTDFIDNSAGVDTSDHEVNIKILLDGVVTAGDMTGKQRNKLLASMTDEVAGLVLNDNYLQTQAISLAEARKAQLLEPHFKLMCALEKAGQLDRVIEFLPDDEEMAARRAAGQGFTRPEYAVLFAYAKIALYNALLPTDVPDDPYLVRDLARYFPKPLRKSYEPMIAQHRLRREIIATYITNSLVNRVGATFVHEIQGATGLDVADVARAYVVARDALALRPLWRSIEALDNRVPAAVQSEMALDLDRLVRRSTLWLLRHSRHPFEIATAIEAYAPGVAELAQRMGEVVADDDEAAIAARAGELTQVGVPEDLARRIGGLEVMESAFDIVRIAAGAGVSVSDVGRVYFTLGERLMADWLRQAARTVKAETEWQRQAVGAIIDDSFAHQAELTMRVLDVAGAGRLGPKAANGVIDVWLDTRRAAFERARAVYGEFKSAPELDLAMLTIANQQLKALITD